MPNCVMYEKVAKVLSSLNSQRRKRVKTRGTGYRGSPEAVYEVILSEETNRAGSRIKCTMPVVQRARLGP